jgi:3-mercaptopyruvate sulfurtransferase SseA
MRRIVSVPIFVIVVLFLSGCQPIQAPAEMQAEVAPTLIPMVIEKRSEVPRIPLDEAKQHFENGTAIFVDSRSASEFEGEHIAGAIHLETGTVDTLENELPKDQLIITYCT